MKTKILALVLALTGLGLRAQSPPGFPAPETAPVIRKLPARFGATNVPTTQPRYQNLPPLTSVAPAAAVTTATPAGSASAAAAGSASGAQQLVNAQPEEIIPAGTINFQGVDVNQVLEIYSQLVGRTLLRAGLPAAQIVLKTQTPLTKTEAIQALQAVLALNGIAVVNIGDKFVKVLPVDQANTAGAEIDHSGSTNLPAMGSYITHITQLHYVKPSVMVPLLTPFAKLANSVFPIDDNGILVIRDNAENVKRMLEMIEQIDVSVPAEYVSEVVPIRYAKVDDIASALNALGGSGGGATVSIGSSSAPSTISGLAGNRASGLSGVGGMGGGGIGGNNPYNSGGIGGGGAFGGQNRSFGSTTGANGTPTTGSTFTQRLNSIIQRATGTPGQQDQIQLFGQTKIVPNESSSSLLIFATRADLAMIKEIIAKLDVPLSQVLIEAVIMDVTLGNTFNLGVSAAQKPSSLNSSGNVIGGGGMNNGNSFANFVRNISTNGTKSISSSLGTNGAAFNNSLPGGFSYFGNIGPLWDVAVSAAESDSHASIIQRPRIQTSQAKPAQFFVGETKPYVTSTYNYGGINGNQSSYSQLSVGVELDVTPFINPDGLVVMDIQQEIDDFNGTTTISGVGDVPNTIKRTINAEIAVRDRDTVMLGGFIKSDKSHSQSGVPFLQDIPLLGNLFKQRTDAKGRQELIVLMRPTVLATPEIAARNTIKESQRLPGISGAAVEDADYEHSLVEAERKKELKDAKNGKSKEGFYNLIYGSDTNANMLPRSQNQPEPAPATDQEKARAALEQKMNELDAQKTESVPAPAPQ
jgi:general secretion pathway protein D